MASVVRKETIESIRKAVNDLDKEMDIDLKNPKYFKDPDLGFQLSCFQYQEYLSKIVVELNQVIVPKGMEVTMFTKEMIGLSKLEWGKGNVYDIDSIMYRCRFLTLFLTEISSHVLDLCERLYRYQTPGVGIYEHGYFYLLDIQDKIKRFVYLFLRGNDWRNLIVKMLEYTFLLSTKKYGRQDKLITISRQLINEIRDGYYHTWFRKPYLDECVIINDIFKLAVLLCAGTGDVNAVPNFSDFEEKVAGKSDYRYEIAYIGKSILLNISHYRKGAKMFQIFEDASPDLQYTLKGVNNNPYLACGCRALDYVGFILDDRCVTSLINKILMRPGWI